MSYISGKEKTFLGLDRGEGFGGFSGVEEDVQMLKDIACASNPAACKKVSSAQATYEAVRKKAQDEILALAGSSYGPILADALSGAVSPAAVAQKAQQFAAAFSTDGVTQAAYKLFYGQSRAAMDLVSTVTTMYPGAKYVYDLAKEGQGIYGQAASLYKKVSGPEGIEAIDAAGIADGVDVVRRVSTVAQRIAVAFGSDVAADIMQEVVEWTGVASGCAAMIGAGTAAGSVAGTVGGAVGCAVTVLSKLLGYIGKPTPTTDYDVQSRAVFLPNDQQIGAITADAQRLAALLRYRYNVASYALLLVPLKGGLGISFGKKVWDYPQLGAKNTPLPGISPWEALYVISYTCGYANVSWWLAPPMKNGDYYRGDFSPEVARNVLLWAQANPSVEYSKPLQVVLGRYLELVRFFGATAMFEAETTPNALSPWQMTAPVRLMGVQYDENRWTGLSGVYSQKPKDLLSGVVSGNQQALEDLGQLRLVAALSYMHMAYHWGQKPGQVIAKSDIVADLPVLNPGDPAAALRTPLNPRANAHGGTLSTVPQLYMELKARNTGLGKIFAAAQTQAFKDHQVQAAGALQKAYFMQKVGAGGGIESPGALKAKIQALEKAGTVFTHTPTTTPTDWMEPAGESGGGGVILAAVAGLAALLLLRK